MSELAEARPRKPTIEDVARLAGVSKGAVSLAVNGRPGVSDATRERILLISRELNWRPSVHARALLRSRAFAIGLVVARSPELLAADPFYGTFIAGVESVLVGSGSVLVLQMAGGDVEVETSSYRRLAEERRVDGVLLIDLRENDERIRLLEELQLRAVVVGPAVEPCPHPALRVDVAIGIERAVEHLVALGHKRIAYVGGHPGFLHSRFRYEAWRNTMRRLGLNPRLSEIGDFTGVGGAAATRRLLSPPSRPSAIVFANDLMAIAGMAAARDFGLSIPGDLSVVGFDDILLAEHVTPPLTTIRQDAIGIGEAAGRLLLAYIEGRPSPEISLEPPELVHRASTAEPRSGPPRSTPPDGHGEKARRMKRR